MKCHALARSINLAAALVLCLTVCETGFSQQTDLLKNVPGKLKRVEDLTKKGDYEGAISEYVEILVLFDRTVGDTNDDLVLSTLREQFAQFLNLMEDFEDSNPEPEVALQRLLAKAELGLGPNHIVVGIVLHHLGQSFLELDDYSKALLFLERSIAIQQRPGNGAFRAQLNTESVRAEALRRRAGNPTLVSQTQHSDEVNELVFSPDGGLLVSSGRDKTIKIWEVKTGRLLRNIRTKVSPASVSFADNGRRLLVSLDGLTELRDIESDGRVWTLGRGTRSDASPNSSFALIAESGVGLEEWTLSDKRMIRTLREKSRKIEYVAMSKEYAAVSMDDGQVLIWDPSTSKTIRRFRHPMTKTSAGRGGKVAITRDGTLVASAMDHEISIWDTKSGMLLASPPSSRSEVYALAFDPSNNVLCFADAGTIVLWSSETSKVVDRFQASDSTITSLTYSPNGGYLAAGSANGTIGLWDSMHKPFPLGSGKRPDEVLDVNFDYSGSRLTLSDEVHYGVNENWLRVWDTKSGVPTASFTQEMGLRSPFFVSPDGETVAAKSGKDGGIDIWNIERRQITRTLQSVSSVSYDANGSKFMAFSEDGLMSFWDARNGLKLWELDWRPNPIRAYLSPDGNLCAVTLGDLKTLRLLDTRTAKPVHTFSGFENPVVSVQFSPDSKVLGTLTPSILRLWNVASGTQLLALSNFKANLPDELRIAWDLKFSPDNTSFGLLPAYSAVQTFDRVSGEMVRMFGEAAVGTCYAFNPSGTLLLTGSRNEMLGNGRIDFWATATGELRGTLSSFNDGSWIVVSPEGYFDGSIQAWDTVLWRFSRKLFDIAPLEAYFSDFFRPGLLAEILSEHLVSSGPRIQDLDRRQPKLSIHSIAADSPKDATTDRRVLSIAIEIDEAQVDSQHGQGGGARDVRLFRNGSLVHVWHGSALSEGHSHATLEATLPIVAGENRLKAYAFNKDNIKSLDAELVVTGAESLRRKGTAYILAIGIDSYSNASYNLRYADADAVAFAEELKRQQIALGNFERVELIPLLDSQATKANILSAFARLSDRTGVDQPDGAPDVLKKITAAEPEDAVFIYFAGHGTARQSQFYLIPYDLGYQGDRKKKLNQNDLDSILAHSISDHDLEQALEKLDASKLVLIIDACNSGQALEAEEKRRGPMNSKGLAQLAYEKGMYILTAAQGYQAAMEVSRLGHGLLTYALVEEGLKTEAADISPKDGQIELREWLDYAVRRVPELQEKIMVEEHRVGREIAFVDDEQMIQELEKRTLQHPRVFYRREPEIQPFVIAKP